MRISAAEALGISEKRTTLIAEKAIDLLLGGKETGEAIKEILSDTELTEKEKALTLFTYGEFLGIYRGFINRHLLPRRHLVRR